MTPKFEWDVAFSFEQKDEKLAFTLHNLLKDRVNSFIYSEEQKKLAGKDGETVFNEVFSEKSRIVVILYNNEWGTTKWTRIEETAIRNKGYEEGYDFVVLIPTAQPVTPPKWLPKNRLWVGLERWGIEAAAGVIEARIQEHNGEIKELSVAEKIVKSDLKIKRQKEINQLLKSPSGAEIADKEYVKFLSEIEYLAKEIQDKLGGESVVKIFPNVYNGINILCYNHCLTIQWYLNTYTSDDSYIYCTISDGYYDKNLYRTDSFYRYKDIKNIKKKFFINELEENGWRDYETLKDFIPTKKFADNIVSDFFEIVDRYRTLKGL